MCEWWNMRLANLNSKNFNLLICWDVNECVVKPFKWYFRLRFTLGFRVINFLALKYNFGIWLKLNFKCWHQSLKNVGSDWMFSSNVVAHFAEIFSIFHRLSTTSTNFFRTQKNEKSRKNYYGRKKPNTVCLVLITSFIKQIF